MGKKLNYFYSIRTCLIFCVFVFSFNYTIAQEVILDTLLNKNVLIGNIEIEHIQDSLWFKENLFSDSLDNAVIPGSKDVHINNFAKIIELLDIAENIHVDAYFGSWCSDSHTWIPYFYFFSKRVGIDDNIKLVGLPKSQKYRVLNFPDKNIIKVPTFIVYLNGEELGRIVENPISSFSLDFLSILKKIPK